MESMREKCPYSELFWTVFSRIQTEYGEVRSIGDFSVGDFCLVKYLMLQSFFQKSAYSAVTFFI